MIPPGLQESLDWIIRAIVALGVPGVIGKFFYDRRRVRAGGRAEEARARIAELTADDKVVVSSVTTQEALRLALQKSFEADRAVKDDTIEFLGRQLASSRQREVELNTRMAEKDALIHQLQERVTQLQEQLRAQADELVRIADQLRDLQEDPIEVKGT